MCSKFIGWYYLIKFNNCHLSFCKCAIYSFIAPFTFISDHIVWLEFKISKPSVSSSCNYVKSMHQFPNKINLYLYFYYVSECWLFRTTSGKCSWEWIEDCKRKTLCSLSLWFAIFLTLFYILGKESQTLQAPVNHSQAKVQLWQHVSTWKRKKKINGEGKYVISSCAWENRNLLFGRLSCRCQWWQNPSWLCTNSSWGHCTFKRIKKQPQSRLFAWDLASKATASLWEGRQERIPGLELPGVSEGDSCRMSPRGLLYSCFSVSSICLTHSCQFFRS